MTSPRDIPIARDTHDKRTEALSQLSILDSLPDRTQMRLCFLQRLILVRVLHLGERSRDPLRLQALTQKWVLHTTYWNRTMREIEAGTCRRDVARAQRHLAERGGVITEEEAIALGIPKSRVKAFVARHQRPGANRPGTATPPAPATATAPKSGPPPLGARGGGQGAGPPPVPTRAGGVQPTLPSLPGLSDRDFEGAYQRYLDAHRKLGMEEQAMPKEKMHSRLGKQLPKILDEKNCDRVRLEIAVEDGKVRLRAWPAEH